MEWLINRRRMMCHESVPPVYLHFEDYEVWKAVCTRYGDYNEIVVTDNGDNTVDITTTFKSVIMLDVYQQTVTVKKSVVVDTQTNVDNSQGTYTAGTTKEPVGITQKQCDAVLIMGNYRSSDVVTNLFKNNTAIISANDLIHFRNLTEIYGNWGGGRSGGFNGCTNLETAEIPESLRVIGQAAFYNCPKLTEFDFKNVTTVNRAAFQQSKIREVVFNTGFTTVDGGGYGAFADLSTVLHFDFPSTTTTINDTKIFTAGRPVIVCRGATPPTLAAQSSVNQCIDIYVPQAYLATYQSAENWSALSAYMHPLEGTWYENHTKKPRGDYDKTFYDAEIEYLESTGTQYIDIRARLGTTHKMIMKYSGFTDEYFACGARISHQSNAFVFANGGSNGTTYDKYYFNRRNRYNSSTTCPNDELVHEVEMTTQIIIDGITVCTLDAGSGNMTTPLFYLFAKNENGTTVYGKMRIYSFKIYDGDLIYADLIPVRIGQVGYMFDKVSGRLLGNSGTGDFILGNDKTE